MEGCLLTPSDTVRKTLVRFTCRIDGMKLSAGWPPAIYIQKSLPKSFHSSSESDWTSDFKLPLSKKIENLGRENDSLGKGAEEA